MEITIKIDDKEFQQQVQEHLVQRTVNRIENEMYPDGKRVMYHYHTMLKEAMRQVLKEHLDDLSERAVAAAAASISNRAMKKYADKVTEAIING